jgi:hypothetical protein
VFLPVVFLPVDLLEQDGRKDGQITGQKVFALQRQRIVHWSTAGHGSGRKGKSAKHSKRNACPACPATEDGCCIQRSFSECECDYHRLAAERWMDKVGRSTWIGSCVDQWVDRPESSFGISVGATSRGLESRYGSTCAIQLVICGIDTGLVYQTLTCHFLMSVRH